MVVSKTARINLSKALVNISLTTIAAIGSATSIPWIAGATALPAAIASSGTLGSLFKRQQGEHLELPAPPFWTRTDQTWQEVCSNIEYHLAAILDTVAAQVQHIKGLPTQEAVNHLLIEAIAQKITSWEIPVQERSAIAAYVAPILFHKASEVLRPALDLRQQETQMDLIVKIFERLSQMQQSAMLPTNLVSSPPQSPLSSKPSIATILEQKARTAAYDVYICYHEDDEAEVFSIGEKLKAKGIMPWFDFLGRPGRLKGKQQDQLIEVIPTAAIFVGQHAIQQWQELQMYAFLNQFVERGCPVIPVLLTSAPSKPKLPPFLSTFVWVDFRRAAPDPLKQLIWGIIDEYTVDE